MNEKLTVEQKFAKVLLNLRDIRPFYSAVYEVMDKTASSTLPTMGVTTDTLYYNRDYVDTIPFSQLLFVVLHEIGHIALKHVARRENRDPVLWNVACDLFVNATLADEFNITPGPDRTINGITISMPLGSLYSKNISTKENYVEEIYENLLQQSNTNGYKQTGSGQFEISGKKNNGGQPTVISISNKNFNLDLSDLGEDQAEKDEKSDKIVSSALVRVEMSGTNYSKDTSGLIFQVTKMLESYVDWRKLLKRYLVKATTSDSSFSKPDKRMLYTKAIYPGQVADELNHLKNVKVCIDTSGSISDTDIQYFFGQVFGLTKQFKIEAELIYWDAEVQSVGEFTDFKEFSRVEVSGRGGTDPSVVFDYFDSKKCKNKPIVTLMFTDGYFNTDSITEKQRKRYKDTIWVMTRGYNKQFKQPFGKKTIAVFK